MAGWVTREDFLSTPIVLGALWCLYVNWRRREEERAALGEEQARGASSESQPVDEKQPLDDSTPSADTQSNSSTRQPMSGSQSMDALFSAGRWTDLQRIASHSEGGRRLLHPYVPTLLRLLNNPDTGSTEQEAIAFILGNLSITKEGMEAILCTDSGGASAALSWIHSCLEGESVLSTACKTPAVLESCLQLLINISAQDSACKQLVQSDTDLILLRAMALLSNKEIRPENAGFLLQTSKTLVNLSLSPSFSPLTSERGPEYVETMTILLSRCPAVAVVPKDQEIIADFYMRLLSSIRNLHKALLDHARVQDENLEALAEACRSLPFTVSGQLDSMPEKVASLLSR